MNKKELLHHLNNECNINVGEKKLREVLKLGKLKNRRQFTNEDVVEVIKALEAIDEEGGTEEGYRKATLLLGGSPSTSDPPPTTNVSSNGHSRNSRPRPTKSNAQGSDRHNTLDEVLDDRVSSFVGGVIRQKAAAFLNSDEGFEYFADIVTEELVGAFDKSFDSWAEEDLRRMRNITPRTVEIEGQSVQGLPSSDELAPDGADFHNYIDPDSENPDHNGGSGE